MIINLSDILSGKIKTLTPEVTYEKKSFEINGLVYEMAGDCELFLEFQNEAKGKGIVTGNFKADFKAVCDRCLDEVVKNIDFQIERDFFAPDNMPEETDDYDFMEGFNIDTDKLLSEELLINWPSQILCKEDCLGLCQVCGHNLNVSECGCDRRVPDIRMAGIMDIFKAER